MVSPLILNSWTYTWTWALFQIDSILIFMDLLIFFGFQSFKKEMDFFCMKYFAHVCFVCNNICNFMTILLVIVGLPCYNNILISTIKMKEYMLPQLKFFFFSNACILSNLCVLEGNGMEPQPFFFGSTIIDH
jgi:hypothetical protein